MARQPKTIEVPGQEHVQEAVPVEGSMLDTGQEPVQETVADAHAHPA